MDLGDFVQGLLFKLKTEGQPEVEQMKGTIDDLGKVAGPVADKVDKLGTAIENMGKPTNDVTDALLTFGEKVDAVQRQLQGAGAASAASMFQAQRAGNALNDTLAKYGITLDQLPPKERAVADAADGVTSQMVQTTANTKAATAAIAQQILSFAGLSTGGLNLEAMFERVGLRFVFITILLRPLLNMIKEAIADHEAFEEALKRTELVLSEFGATIAGDGESVGQWAKGMAQVSGIVAGDVLNSFDKFMLKTQDVASAMDITTAAMVLAQVTGEKMSVAVTDIESALDGNGKKLAEYGIHLDATTVSTLKFGDAHTNAQIILAAVQQQLGTANETLTNHGSAWQNIANWVAIAARAYGLYNTEADKDKNRGLPNAPGVTAPNGKVPYGAVNMKSGALASLGLDASGQPISLVEAAGAEGFFAAGPFNSQPSAYSLQSTAGRLPASASAAAAANVSKAVSADADAYQHADDMMKKLNDSSDAVAKKQDQIRLSFDAANKSLDAQMKILLPLANAGDAVAKQEFANLSAQKAAGEQSETAQLAAAAAGKDNSVEQAKLDEAIQHSAVSAGDFYDEMVRGSDIPSKAVDPIAAAVDAVDKRFAAMDDDSQKWKGVMVDSADHAVSAIMAIGPAIDYYRQKAEQAATENVWDQIAKQVQTMVDTADRELDTFGQRTETSLSKSGLFSDAELSDAKTKIDAILSDAQTQIKQIQLLGGLFGLSEDDQKARIAEAKQAAIDNVNIIHSGLTDAGKAFETIIKSAANDFGNILAGFTTGGGSGLLSALDGIFKKTSSDFGKDLANSVIVAFGGKPDKNAPQYQGPGGQEAFNAANALGNQQVNSIASATLAAGAGITDAIQNSSKETVAQMAVSAAATGYAVAQALAYFGGPVGVIAGVVVGLATFAAGLFSPSDNTGKFYTHINVKNNQVDFGGNDGHQGLGYSDEQQKEIFESIQQTIDTFENGFTELMFNFGHGADLLAEAGRVNLTDAQNAWNGAASKGFNDAMNAWIKTGLPGMIQDSFAKPLEEGLQSIGFSTAAAQGILAKMNTMAPADALKYVTSLVAAVNEMEDQLSQLKDTPVFAAPGGGFDLGASGPSMWQQASDASNPWQTFMTNSDDAIVNIQKLAAEIPNLSGQDEVTAIQTAADDMKAFRQSEIQLLQQLQAAQAAVSASFDSLVEKYKLQQFTNPTTGKVDYAGEEAYLEQERQAQLKLAMTSTDPTVVQNAAAKAAALLDQEATLAEQAGPQNAAAWQKFVIEEAQKNSDAINAHLKSLADPLIEMNQKLEDAMGPVIAAFLKLGEAMGNGPAGSPLPGSNPTGSPGDVSGHGPGSHAGSGGDYDAGNTGNSGGSGHGAGVPGPVIVPGEYQLYAHSAQESLDSQQVSAATLAQLQKSLEAKMQRDLLLHAQDAAREDARLVSQLDAIAAGPKEGQLSDVIDLLAQIRDAAASGTGGDLIVNVAPNNTRSTFSTRVINGRTGG